LPCFVRASFANIQDGTTKARGVDAQCVCVGPKLARCVHKRQHTADALPQDDEGEWARFCGNRYV
jgi:uroporphyrinogen-III synthase